VKCSLESSFLLRAFAAGLRQDGGEEMGGNLRLEQPVTIFGKHCGVPRLLVQSHVEKPAEQDVVADLLNQLTLAADRIESLQQ